MDRLRTAGRALRGATGGRSELVGAPAGHDGEVNLEREAVEAGSERSGARAAPGGPLSGVLAQSALSRPRAPVPTQGV
jgi:hypothetical protein